MKPPINEYTVRSHEQSWFKLRYHPVQYALSQPVGPRFRLCTAGRRSGKTLNAKRYAIRKLLRLRVPWEDPRALFGAPTHQQAKNIWWKDLKRLIHPGLIRDISEGELRIELITGHEFWVRGLDAPARVEGMPWDMAFLDEFGNMKPGVWEANVGPALSDRRGEAWLFGVPEGAGTEYHKLYDRARSGEDQQFAAYHWRSEDILPPEEIALWRSLLDEHTYEQEYGGQFVTASGAVYYNFSRALHANQKLSYDPSAPLILALDFNVSPGVAAIGQEQRLPNGLQGTGWIDSVYIMRNSNTEAVCRKFIELYQARHHGEIRVYGDATGGGRSTAGLSGSDWDIAKTMLQRHFPRIDFYVPRSGNPPVRSRINAVNSRLMSLNGDIRMMVDQEQTEIIRDFENTLYKADGSSEIDKRAGTPYSHLTDALGYYCHREFPVIGRTITMVPTAGF